MWLNTESKVKSWKDVLYGRFSSRFLFGAATSGYQHESAIHGDRDFALWDLQGIRGPHLSADILKHMDDDINLMKILKLKTYSMTIRSVIMYRELSDVAVRWRNSLRFLIFEMLFSWTRMFGYTSYNNTAQVGYQISITI